MFEMNVASTGGKILVIRGGAIGDFILTLPAIAALRNQFPQAHLEILGYPHIAQLALAGGLVAVAIFGHRTIYEGFLPAYPDHHGLIAADRHPDADLDGAGIALDFKVIKNLLAPSLDLFDHQYLNNFVERPSAELIGLKILRDMQQLIETSTVYKKYVRLHAIEVFESPESCCRIEV